MSTRCLIGKENDDKSVTYIYCHHDGYIDGVGKILLNHYDLSNIDKLMSLGDLSALGTEPKTNMDYWKSFDYMFSLKDDECVSYRDRGETDVDAKTANSVNDFFDAGKRLDYTYILRKDGKWFVYFNNDVKSLKRLVK